jgi:proline iminopeptidase
VVYPAVEPYESGHLDVGDGNHVYWETCGRPDGAPAVVLHGGPGSGCVPGMRRFFDPSAYRVVLFDQRGCGRSTPHASELSSDLSVNTTAHLVSDIERLRVARGVETWLVFGGSWGSTLALAYAEAHPERVRALVLFGVATTTRAEIEWLTRGLGRLFPKEWSRFRDGAAAALEADGDLVSAYARLLADGDAGVRERAARSWCEWEDAIVRLRADDPPNPRYEDARFRMAFARIVTHYWRHGAWLEAGQLVRDVDRIASIPGVMVHGRLDLGSPLATPWALAQSWPASELVVVEGAGHFGDAMVEPLLAATDRFRLSA